MTTQLCNKCKLVKGEGVQDVCSGETCELYAEIKKLVIARLQTLPDNLRISFLGVIP